MQLLVVDRGLADRLLAVVAGRIRLPSAAAGQNRRLEALKCPCEVVAEWLPLRRYTTLPFNRSTRVCALADEHFWVGL